MISTTRNTFELTRCINIRYALIELYLDASIFGYASRMYQSIKDIMTLYVLEKSLYNAIYYNFDETEVETLIYKIREYLGILNYGSNVDYFITKYPGITTPAVTPDNIHTPGDGEGNTIITNITNTYPTTIIERNTTISSDFLSQDLTSLITVDGQTTIEGLNFTIGDVDPDILLLEVQGDNPNYSLAGDGYHIEGNILHWHNFYDLKVGMQVKIRWKIA